MYTTVIPAWFRFRRDISPIFRTWSTEQRHIACILLYINWKTVSSFLDDVTPRKRNGERNHFSAFKLFISYFFYDFSSCFRVSSLSVFSASGANGRYEIPCGIVSGEFCCAAVVKRANTPPTVCSHVFATGCEGSPARVRLDERAFTAPGVSEVGVREHLEDRGRNYYFIHENFILLFFTITENCGSKNLNAIAHPRKAFGLGTIARRRLASHPKLISYRDSTVIMWMICAAVGTRPVPCCDCDCFVYSRFRCR